MKEKLLTLILEKKESLIVSLVNSGYAFAAWRMPETEEVHLIISLKKVEKISSSFSEMENGFIVNQFDDNHPPKPYLIHGDIIIRKNEVILDPRINDTTIDTFLGHLKDHPEAKIAKTSSSINLNSSSYLQLVEEAISEISNGTFEKVVLSRFTDYQIPESFAAWDLFQKVQENYLNSFCSLFHIPEMGIWIGASPELILSETQKSFKTVALAGTKKIESGQALSEITWTQKEIEEQALVSRYIINCFKKIRLREFHEHGPKTVKAGNLAHLKTEFEVDYGEVTYDGLADQMLELLHPTSAVCGMPIEQTKPWIKIKENYNREFYSGFLGPVGFNQEIHLYVNLRCVKIQNDTIRFYAGAGITEDSNPAKEFDETELKMNILKLLIA